MSDFVIPGFFLLFLVIWIMVSILISRLSGWGRLAVHYRREGTFHGRIWRFQSISMRKGMGYNNAVNVGASPNGLYLSPVLIFKPGHMPLFVRWGEVAVRHKRILGFRRVELRFQRVRDVPIVISPRLAERLSSAAGSEWPGQDQV
jgi:hypothetical protein